MTENLQTVTDTIDAIKNLLGNMQPIENMNIVHDSKIDVE